MVGFFRGDPRVMTPLAVVGSAILFLLVLAALGNLAFSGGKVPAPLKSGVVLAHLATVLMALPLGVSQLLLPKGTLRHRILGYVWCALMVTTALISFSIHTINPGSFDPIYIFSIITLICAPLIVFFGRTGRVRPHERTALGLMVGALVIAGFFTLLPSRALGQLVFRLFHLR